MLQIGGVVGTFALGSVIDRFSFRALALVYLVAVFAVAAIGQLGHSAIPVSIAIFAAGFCVVGGQIAANALTAGYYPTSVRATGVGWALGIGRVGSIIGPLVAGVLIDAKWSTGALFMAAAAAAACAALASLLLSRIAGCDQRTANVIDGCYIEAGDHSPDLNVRASQGAADELFRSGEQAAQSRRSPRTRRNAR